MAINEQVMSRPERIRRILDGYGFTYYSQTGMPGRRWTVWHDHMYSRAFTTAELEVFLEGYRAGIGGNVG